MFIIIVHELRTQRHNDLVRTRYVMIKKKDIIGCITPMDCFEDIRKKLLME